MHTLHRRVRHRMHTWMALNDSVSEFSLQNCRMILMTLWMHIVLRLIHLNHATSIAIDTTTSTHSVASISNDILPNS